MSARWPEWFRKVGDTATHPAALNIGKKLLGYLATRRESPGVQTLVKRVTLDDGTVVEARFDGDQPRVTVYAVGGEQAACELYVESGLLDLGPNIAPDAGKRFNRGPPQFDDRPATLYFGTGVGCSDSSPGLNGKIKIDLASRHVTSECLPSQGGGIQSRLTDPKKKQAQALLPASCWSGLMQRYVQAVYGGDSLEYSGTPKTLVIEGIDIPAEASMGLVAHNGKLRFVVFDPATGVIDAYACSPTSSCFAACLDLWRSMPEHSDADDERKQKVLSIALSGCKVGRQLERINTGIVGNVYFSGRPALHFSADGTRASTVVESGGTATAYEIKFSIVNNELLIAASSVSSGRVLTDPRAWPMRVSAMSSAFAGNVISDAGFQDGGELEDGSEFDYPVYALCARNGIDVVRYSLLVSSDVATDSDDCVDAINRPTNFGPEPPCSSSVRSFNNVVSGYYCVGGAGVRWSAIEKTTVAKGNDGLATEIDPAQVKALAIIPVGEEREERTPVTGLVPEAVYLMSTSSISPAADDDCLHTIGNSNNHRILTGTSQFSAPPGTCDVIRDWTWGPCVGPSSGTGFPPYISESTCDFNYGFGTNGITAECYNVVRARDAQIYALWTYGDLLSPRPHAISMCSGSYDFIIDRHAITAFNGAYASKEDTWQDFESRYVCDFSGSLNKHIANSPGGLCNGGNVTTNYIGDLSGRYEYQFQGYELLRRAVFSDWLSSSEINDLAKQLQRGNENYKSVSSYGEYISKDGSFSFDTKGGAPKGYSAKGAMEIMNTCKFTEHLFIDDVVDEPIATKVATSGDDVARWSRSAPDTMEVILGGFTYACASSLLGATIKHTLQVERGYSIHMDRQTITGGYLKVNTPSFVGWA